MEGMPKVLESKRLVEGLIGDRLEDHRVVGTCFVCASGGRGKGSCWQPSNCLTSTLGGVVFM